MSTDVLSAVRTFLNSLGMHVTTEWLSGCVEFFCEDSNQRINNQELCNMVKNQWILGNLQDISPGCLPPNLCNQVKTTLKGTYVLQMNSLIDIGSPAYQQLQKINKIDLTNIEATINATQEISSQSTRMFKLHLTDGVQQIFGIEYKPMRNLTSSLTPGIKIQIKGPVDCRRGVLILEEKHVVILGGEVDDMLECNNYKNVLLRIVENNKSPDNSNTGISYTKEKISITNQTIPLSNNSNSINPSTRTVSNIVNIDENDLEMDAVMFNDEDFDMSELDAIERQVVNKNVRNVSSIPDNFSSSIVSNLNSIPLKSEPPCNNSYKQEIPSTSNQKYSVNLNSYNAQTHLTKVEIKPQQSTIVIDDTFREDLEDFDEYFNEPAVINDIFNRGDVSVPSPKVKKLEYMKLNELADMAHHIKLNNTYKTKTKVDKIIGKLSFQKSEWILKCTLVDDTGKLDVDISSDVLSEMIGYTPEQMIKIKKQMSSKPELKQEVVKGLDSAMSKIQNLNGYLYIIYKENGPCVINTE